MFECPRCDRYFPFRSAFEQHRRDSPNHHVCYECHFDSSTWRGLEEHWIQSPKHHYCRLCEEHFDDDEDLMDHNVSNHHTCVPCRRTFSSQRNLEEHYRQSQVHHYCAACKRHFQSASNLNAHLNSSTHRPKDVPCPFRGCDQAFVSRSALILHLESGYCRSGVDRGTIDRFVRKYDRSNVITDPSRLLTSGHEDEEVKYYATNASWNGNAYECYLCHATYRSLTSLNQHLASPRHQEKIYLCPLNTCRTRFTTLSALCQHIESERCGVAKFNVVKKTLDSLVGQMGRITL